MTAIETLLAGLFDYAGLYPPTSLSLRSAANNYLEYARSKHASALGRFIINLDRLDELRPIAGEFLDRFRISVIAADGANLETVAEHIRSGMLIETLEIKCNEAAEIEGVLSKVPSQLTTYIEVPVNSAGIALLKTISDAGARAKIRMGGVVPEAIPSASDVAEMLKALADLRLPFKATAGLHHPVRSRRPLTYQPQSPIGTMHGFMDLCCATAALCFGGEVGDSEKLIREEDPSAWQVSPDGVQWRHMRWSEDQLARLRRDFFISIGSCSFEEPLQDLESLGWL